MAGVQIKRVSVKHDAILDYMLVNPGMKLSKVARHFDVSQAWLSVIIHSDAFQAKLAEKDGLQYETIVIPLREQVMGVAQVGVEKLGECLENASASSDKQFIADTTDSLLKNLGYSPKSAAPSPPAAVQQNFFVADKESLEKAREKMRTIIPEEGTSLNESGVLIENDSGDAAETVQTCGGCGMGKVLAGATAVYTEGEEERKEG